jgi:outer membrane lipoprotein-sorting protein
MAASDRRPLLALVLAAFSLPAAAGESIAGPDPRAILEEMGRAVRDVRDYTMVLDRQERIGERLLPQETMRVKWARPQSMYVYYLEPHRSREAIYVEGANKNRIKAHKGSFPDLTVNISPTGSTAMKRSHHPMSQASIPFLVDLILSSVRRAEREGEGEMRWVMRERRLDRDTDKLELKSPAVFARYTTKKGETLWDVGRRFGVPMHSVLHFNRDRGWDGPKDPRAGDEVRVPRYPAGRVILWIDRELHLPIEVAVFDHEGKLYERYRHRDLRVNVGLKASDFDPKNPDYGF